MRRFAHLARHLAQALHHPPKGLHQYTDLVVALLVVHVYG